MERDKKTILITGGAGFIGSHLCEKYLNEGHKVLCLDNLQTTFTPKNIEKFFSNKDFKFLEQDIIDPIKLNEKIDWIFNLACSGSYTSYQYDPIHTIKTNTIGIINVLELAKKNNAKVLQASTSEVYGDPLETPQKENYNGNVSILGPRACYDEGKRCAETLFMDYHRKHGLDIKIVRIFNTYGPNMDTNDGRAVTNFIVNAIAGNSLAIYGDGSHTRSFQYIDDLVEGMDKMMKKDGFIGPVNIGNPGEVTMLELANLVIKKIGSSSKIKYEKAATDDPKRRCPDISLAKNELGWEPKVSLEKGLEKTMDFFMNAEHPTRKMLVFATTYYPKIGPAENALLELSKETPETEFYIITSKLESKLPSYEKFGTDHIYRVGIGSKLDKYLLPILGTLKANELNKKNNFRFVWSVMASYGAIPAIILKIANKNMNFLLTIDEKELEKSSSLRSKLISYIHGMAFKHADSVYLPSSASNSKIKAKTSLRDANSKKFADEVQSNFKTLLDQQEKKLPRAK